MSDVLAADRAGSTREPLSARGERTRKTLIAAARSVFEQRGFDGTRMGDIAEAAGVSHGTVYTWFATKEELLHAVVDSIAGALYSSLSVPEATSPMERVSIANERYLAAYRETARLLEVVEQAAVSDASFRAVLANLRTTHVQRVAKTIRRWQREGAADASIDPQVGAAALCAMVEGFARHWLGRGEQHDEQLAMRTLTELWAQGLGLTRGGQ
jgi:AcrR family transcriptional regulator